MAAPERIEPTGDGYLEQKERHPNSYYYTVALDARDRESRFLSPELLPNIRKLLGGKGTNLITLTEIASIKPHIHVPPGFIISTEAWTEARELDYAIPAAVWTEVLDQLADLEYKTGCSFGDDDAPLVVSARSGAEKSMPGMLDTVINIGINDETVVALEQQIGPSAAWEAYFALVADLGKTAFNIDPAILGRAKQQLLNQHNVHRLNQLPPALIQQLVTQAKEVVAQQGFQFPQDPYDQLQLAIPGVFASWDKQKAADYRNRTGIPNDPGTAVTIQQIAFGNSNKQGAGSGVLVTRDSRTLGPAKTTFAKQEQGTAAVGDAVRNETDIPDLPFPRHIIQEIERIIHSIDATMRLPQQLEYTFDGEKLCLLQMRDERLEPLAYFRRLLEISGITRDDESAVITPDEAMRLIPTAKLQSLLQPGLDPIAVKKAESEGRLLTTGIPISLGHATALAITEETQAAAEPGQKYILVSSLTTQRLTDLPPNIAAYITPDGSIGSHNASTARLVAGERGIPIVFGADTANIQQGQIVTVDGTSGKIFAGAIPVSKDGNGALNPLERTVAEEWLEQKCRNPWLYVYPSWVATTPDLDPALAEIEQSMAKLESHKAAETVAAQALIPEEIRMNYQVVKPHQQDKIRQLVTDALASGNHATVRTCYRSDRRGKAPYAIITNEEELARFLTDSDTYIAWRDDPDCTEFTVGSIPKDKLSKDPAIKSQHCSWTLSITEGGEVVLQVHPHSPDLRAHEPVGEVGDIIDEDRFITFTTKFAHSPETADRLPLPPELRQQFADNPEDLAIVGAMYRKMRFLAPIQPKVGKSLRGDVEALTQACQVADTVFEEWWHDHHLPLRLAMIAQIFPRPEFAPPVLEGQARTGPDGWRAKVFNIKDDPKEE